MREEILARIFAVIQALPGLAHVARNDVDIPESRLPAVVVIDGNETADEGAFNRGRPPHGPNLIAMTPMVYVEASAEAGAVGTVLNGIRESVLSALRSDATLLNLLHAKDIRYEGCQVALESGKNTIGEMLIEFSLTYVQR